MSQGKKIPTTLFGRATSLIGAGAKMVGREIVGTVNERFKDNPEYQRAQLRIKQAQDLVESLSHLKGAAMKVGQLLSLEMSDLLPPEVVDILRTLHDNATFLPADEIKKILKNELGPKKYSELTDISETPLAAASIGQVHRARLNGEEVILKVQYPLVAESIDTDLALLKKMINGALAVRGRQISFDAVFSELAQGLKIETDYEQEARALDRYRTLFSNFPQYVIPKVYATHSTRKLLTLSYEPGERLNAWIKRPMGEMGKERFARMILDLLVLELFHFGVVQTDPNYGNFLVREGGESLVLLDFGAVKEYPKELRLNLHTLLGLAVDEKKPEFLALGFQLGFLDQRESEEVKELFYSLMQKVGSMFRPENQPFNFSDELYINSIREQSIQFANCVRHTSPAHQIIFLNRKLGGMFHLLKDVHCKVDLSTYWEQVSALS